jgi:hypothetical protein
MEEVRVGPTSLHQNMLSSDNSIETFGEDFVLVSHMGVAYSSGLSKNGALSDSDAAVPVLKVGFTVPSSFSYKTDVCLIEAFCRPWCPSRRVAF